MALDGVSLSAVQGEILAIVGDNGAGKSTLIKILSVCLCRMRVESSLTVKPIRL